MPMRTALLIVSLLTIAACGRREASPAPPPAASNADVIARGEYLARAGDCVACHTVPGGTEYVGGRAFKLKMGTIYSPNITPDRETGIGNWSDDDFVRAMQKGVAPDGSHYYPAFPYNYFTLLDRPDLLAIKAYLFTLPASRSRAPESQLHWPFNHRRLMVFWNALYNPNRRFEPEPSRSAQWNRGAFLVQGPAHCGACHTPMSILQGPKAGHAFAGETLQGWHAYNITPDKQSGIGAWSDADLLAYLSTGHASGHGSASGPMAEAISFSLSHLTQDDLRAMIAYLRTVEPRRDESAPEAAPKNGLTARDQAAAARELVGPHSTGARIFAGACANCHSWDGAGVETSYAELAGSRALHDPRATNVTRVILEGTKIQTATGQVFMPAFGAGYSDAEVAALVSFTTQWFGQPVTLVAEDVAARRDVAHAQ